MCVAKKSHFTHVVISDLGETCMIYWTYLVNELRETRPIVPGTQPIVPSARPIVADTRPTVAGTDPEFIGFIDLVQVG
jgi:hypothetical protein